MSPSGVMIEIDLNAVIVSVDQSTPYVLTVPHASRQGEQGLPYGPFDPLQHRTFEIGLRSFVEMQTALKLGHVEQLYTFGDRGRHMVSPEAKPHVVSVGYLALTRQTPESDEILAAQGAKWRSWYDFFPWEDWRQGKPALLEEAMFPLLRDYCDQPHGPDMPSGTISHRDRFQLSFGAGSGVWDEERALDRYEMLYGAGLTYEARRDGRPEAKHCDEIPPFGESMTFDHRRILATALSRLRAKLKYRPVVFELMPPEFTLTDLQRTVEAISGQHLHKQNFRRLVEGAHLVEPTGRLSTATGGRPAALYQFRRDILTERPTLGLRVGRH
ncbi:NrtR DNA-binding winged helix domain-containing protein [Pseudovibrio sp. SPO723]|uniref:NUDIX hydrolase n=1 Tax=Nesiotobacter zosterae TaxID=392721 RepID=UPI0029C46192|nr:NAD regulator [Pseudovibrio sp. SPO723]MDX5593093.1 NAD regulator [Pseudovibrio sp. SPO723]